MGIYQREGWWWARKTIKRLEYRDPLGTQSKREAEAAYARWLTDLENKIRGSKRGQRKETTFQEAVDNFTENHFPTLKPSARVRYLQSLLILTPHFEGKTLQEIGKADIGTFVTERRKAGVVKGKQKRPIKDSTIIRDLQCLSGVFTIAADFELFDDANPAAAYLKTHQRRKTLRNSKPRERYFSHREETLVLEHALAQAMEATAIRRAEKGMIACAIALYIDLGFRAQELLNARREWVDFDRNEITVPKEFSKSGEPRTIPLFPRARRILLMLPINKHTDLLLWRCKSGKRFSDLNKTFQKLAAEVGITGVEIHDLRRTCGCRLLQDHRMTMAEVSRYLGHASVEQTESTYAFLKVENLHDAIGGRVLEHAARLQLTDMFQMQFVDIAGEKAVSGLDIDKRLLIAKGNEAHG